MAELKKDISFRGQLAVQAIAYHNPSYDGKKEKFIVSKIRLSYLGVYYADFTLPELNEFIKGLKIAIEKVKQVEENFSNSEAEYTTRIEYKRSYGSSPAILVQKTKSTLFIDIRLYCPRPMKWSTAYLSIDQVNTLIDALNNAQTLLPELEAQLAQLPK